MKRKVVVVIMILLLGFVFTGCATIVRGDKQQVNINTYDAETNYIVSSNCTVTNDEGTFKTRSDREVFVERDKDLLRIDCETEDFQGSRIVDGKVDWGFLAIDFFGVDLCIISCWIDGFTGSWAEYPVMIDVPMDRKTKIKNTN